MEQSNLKSLCQKSATKLHRARTYLNLHFKHKVQYTRAFLITLKIHTAPYTHTNKINCKIQILHLIYDYTMEERIDVESI